MPKPKVITFENYSIGLKQSDYLVSISINDVLRLRVNSVTRCKIGTANIIVHIVYMFFTLFSAAAEN